jgi:hypothetical protein
LTSIGLWAGGPRAAEAQAQTTSIAEALTSNRQAPVAETPAKTLDSPNQPSYTIGLSGYLPVGETINPFGWTENARESEAPVSVVTFKTPNQTNLDETAEDLRILSLIFAQHLEHALGGEGGEAGDYKLGIPMLLQTGGRWVEASYLEGFGAVFNLKVRFPLAPAAVSDKDTQSRPQDSEWEQARRALAGAAPAGSGRANWNVRYVNNHEKVSPYNPKLVETLKKRVLELLRNASHLRHVQPDEWVAVTFAGPPNGSTSSLGAGVGSSSAGMGSLGAGSIPIDEQPNAPAKASGPSTTTENALAGAGTPSEPKRAHTAAAQTPERATFMTIRIKKKDADAFAANQMSEDQFFHAAEITSYLGPVLASGADGNYFLRLQPR